MPGDRTAGWTVGGILPPLLFALAALGLRLWQLDQQSIWLDEAFTAVHSTLPAADLWTHAVTNKPPLYYHFTSLFWSPGDGLLFLRLPAALFGAATVFLAWHLGMAAAGRRAAYAYALFLLISDLNIMYSQDARHYTLLSAGWMMVLLAGVRMARRAEGPGAFDLGLLGVGAVLMCHAHLIAIHYLAATAVGYVAALAAGGNLTRRHLLRPAAACVLAGLTLLPWWPVLRQLLLEGRHGFGWLEQPPPINALVTFLKTFGTAGLYWLWKPPWTLLAALGAAALSVGGLALHALRRDRPAGVLLLGALLAAPLLIWLTGLAWPVYYDRTLMPVHVLGAAGLALLVAYPEWRPWRLAGLLAMTGLLALSALGHFRYHKKDDWRGLADQLRARHAEGEAVYLCRHYWYHAFEYHLQGLTLSARSPALSAGRYLVIDRDAGGWRIRCRDADCAPPLPAGDPPRAFWVVDWRRAASACEPAQVAADLRALGGTGYAAAESWRGHGVSLTAYRPSR